MFYPGHSEELDTFQEKFGGSFWGMESGGPLVYEVGGIVLSLADCTQKELSSLIAESYQKGKDLVYERFKDCIWQDDPDVVY